MVMRFRFNVLLYLTAILAALKVAEVIDWSWGWILAPLWMPVALVLGIAVVGFFFAARLLAKLKKSLGVRAASGKDEIVINDGNAPVAPGASSSRRVGNVYDHEQS